MFDFIYTRKDGHAFGLERSGFLVPTLVKDRRKIYYNKKIKRDMNISRRMLDEKHNPLIKKKVRHG